MPLNLVNWGSGKKLLREDFPRDSCSPEGFFQGFHSSMQTYQAFLSSFECIVQHQSRSSASKILIIESQTEEDSPGFLLIPLVFLDSLESPQVPSQQNPQSLLNSQCSTLFPGVSCLTFRTHIPFVFFISCFLQTILCV